MPGTGECVQVVEKGESWDSKMEMKGFVLPLNFSFRTWVGNV